MRSLSPLSCSMTSGKSGRWCDASLSCLRISTPQKPWSPTAELKTCWLLTMDSRTLYLPASASAALSTIQPFWTSIFWPQVSVVPLMSRLGLPSVFPTISFHPQSSFVLHSWSHLPSYFCFSQVFYFILWVHPRHFQCVHPFLHTPPLPSPSLNTPRVLAVSVESGSMDSSTLVLSFLLGIVFWIDWTMVGSDWRCLRLIC